MKISNEVEVCNFYQTEDIVVVRNIFIANKSNRHGKNAIYNPQIMLLCIINKETNQ